MFLKCIEMTGFKSFPEKTIMHMNGSITGVVGPNGSGKSNVSDAVRWVLGEQSPKTLRGTVMQDVIFAGTQARKPRSFCEVTLIFDNSDSRIGTAYSEIEVTRKLYSSGEGEYYLNGTKCRLKDILTLFRDTGIGKEGYSIIGQGRIDEILSERSLDRRRIFEEASGIMKYRVRKEEAERKLEKTRFNLIRVEDILQEQNLRLAPLKDQADEAMEYLKLTERLKTLEVNLFLHAFEGSKERIERLKQTKQSLVDEKEQKETHLKELSSLLLNEQENTKALEETGSELAEKLSVSLAEIERVDGEINLCGERISNLEKDSLRLSIEIEETESKSKTFTDSEKQNSQRILQIENEIAALNESIDEISKELSALTGDFEERARVIEAVQNEKIETVEKIGDIKGTQLALKEKESFTLQRISDTESRIDAACIQREEYEGAKQKLDNDIKNLEQQSSGIRNLYNEKVLSKNTLATETALITQTLETLRRDYASCMSSLRLLGDMKNSYEGYIGSVRKLMTAAKEDKDIGGRIKGTFAGLIKVPQEFETAVESCLGSALQDIVVDDEYDAKHIISFLRKNDLGRVTFLPLNALQVRTLTPLERKCLSSSGVCGLASELISCDNKAQNACDFLLGRTVIAEDNDAAIRIMRENQYSFRTVTLQGDVFNPGGAITGGSVRRDSAGIVSRDRKEDELKSKSAELENKIKKTEEDLDTKQKQQDILIYEIEGIRLQLHSNDIEMSAVKEKLESVIVSLNDVKTLEVGLKQQIEQLGFELNSIKNDFEKNDAIKNDIQQISVTKDEGYKQLEEEYSKSVAAIEEKRRVLHEAEIKIAELYREKASLDNDAVRLETEKKDLERSKVAKNKMLELNAESKENLLKLKEELDSLRLQKNAVSEDIRKQQSEITYKRDELKKALADRDEKLMSLRQELTEISEKIMRAEFNVEKADTLIQETQNKLWDTYRLTYANAVPLRQQINISEAQNETEVIKEKIRDIGSVNPNAIEDYNELKERMQTLTTQKDDLIGAEKDLHELIASLLGEMRKTFKTSFDQINKYFNQTFQELFNGGSAKLVLEDEQDIMECGIEIVAEPPGKKLQKISLLSGGEKALTAISLLFALLKINPSPVCILDEIDAALDDANVYKFSEYLQKYAQNMQFIVITHRKPTMIVCDSLYGFAMEEKGVSKLLSVRLE